MSATDEQARAFVESALAMINAVNWKAVNRAITPLYNEIKRREVQAWLDTRRTNKRRGRK